MGARFRRDFRLLGTPLENCRPAPAKAITECEPQIAG
jgi:hypothetical protein